jgi:hypothetical protein
MAAGFGANMTLKSQNSFPLQTSSTGTSQTTIVTGKGPFGVTEYKTTTTTIQANNGIRATNMGNAAGGGGITTGTSAATGFTTAGMRRAPAYYTAVGKGLQVPPMPPARMQADLRSMLAQTAALPSARSIDVLVNNDQGVILQGVVGSEEERTLAAGLISLTPGVHYVDNQILVQPR